MYDYSYYGNRLRSPFPLTLLPPWDTGRHRETSPNDAFGIVTLKQGEVPDELPDTIWTTPFLVVGRCRTVIVRVAAAGRFLVRGGAEVIVQPIPGIVLEELETFLVGAVAGIILHQRRVLPLHASCVAIGGRAIVLAGPSGLGKSTLAAALAGNGATLLSDDISAITFHGAAPPRIAQGAIGLRLWPDAKAALGMEAMPWLPIRRDHPKLVSPVSSQEREPCELSTVIRLLGGNSAEPGIRRRYGPSAVAPMTEMVYRARLGRMLGCQEALFLSLMRIADTVPVFELRRPSGVDRIGQSVDWVLSVVGAKY
jgi:hypothetical protein